MNKKKIFFSLDTKVRLDQFLSEEIYLYSRSRICNFIKENVFYVNGKIINKCSFTLLGKGFVEYDKNLILEEDKHKELEPWDKKELIEIICETDDYLIINKPINLIVHPGVGNKDKTLVNILLSMNIKLSKMNTNRPGIVHRLDKNTSGLMIVAKNDKFHDHIQNEFENGKVIKKYEGLIVGLLEYKEGMIELPIGRDTNNRKIFRVTQTNSKECKTEFKVVREIKGNHLLEFNLITGRTHQIRVHMKYLKHPLYNDPEYGKQVLKDKGQFLHSKYIEFVDLNKKRVYFEKNKNFSID